MVLLISGYITIDITYTARTSPVQACGCAFCAVAVVSCSTIGCSCQSLVETPQTIEHTLNEFQRHEEWLIKNLWEGHVLPSMMLMTKQLTSTALQQTQIIGTLFDAKHQLESQRLLQELQAGAHKDYHPSTGMCRFGTNTRSLVASERHANVTQIALATRGTQRRLMTAGAIGTGGGRDDSRSRLKQFRTTYCNPADFGFSLDLLCEGADKERYNKDVNYTHALEDKGTLKLLFTDNATSPDEEDILALGANLYGNRLLPIIADQFIADAEGNFIDSGAGVYMDTRALAAKRSVAYNSFAAISGLRSEGRDSVLPYMTELLEEMGMTSLAINTLLGVAPSYNAQMEVLTKKLYQTPNFYSNLYDKPVNIDRKDVAMHAIGLMQKRDIYRSQLRSEANMSVWLETEVEDLQDYHNNEAAKLRESSNILTGLGLPKNP